MTSDGSSSAASSTAVLQVRLIPAQRAAQVLSGIYPDARVSTDPNSNDVIVSASLEEIEKMRELLQALDTKDPRRPSITVVHLSVTEPSAVASRLSRLFNNARFEAGPNRTLLVFANPADVDQIKAVVTDIDAVPLSRSATAVLHISQADPKNVARLLAHEIGSLRADVSGSEIVLTGSADAVSRGKELASALDQPASETRYAQAYRFRYIDAASAQNLLQRTFPGVSVIVDKDLNAVTVTATAAQQSRIADGISRLDTPAGGAVDDPQITQGAGGSAIAVVKLHAAIPGLNGTPSTTPSDIAGTVMQALGSSAPDLHITVEPDSTRLVLSGDPYQIKMAKSLIQQLDTTDDLVVLDTQILELDDTSAKNLGITAGTPGTPFLSTTIGEYPPQLSPAGAAAGASPPPFFSIQPLTRTPLSLSVQLNALIQNGSARILADPRITTISGRTATIRAGDNISVLTTTPASVGVPASSQIQTFQTGVTLDITPVINEGNLISVQLHPTVNSLTSVNGEGIPQISTRDSQTTVAMRADQTLIIGGLIEDDTTSNQQKIPILSDIPLIGRLFRGDSVNHQRNELVITVTPHIIHVGDLSDGSQAPGLPTPVPLASLSPGMLFPPPAINSIRIPPGPSAALRARPQFSPSTTPRISGFATSPAPSLRPGQRPTFTVPDATPTPFSLSTAQGPPGTYTYGQPTANIYAGPSDAASIYYVTLSPNVVHNGTAVTFTAITSTNVARLLLLNGNAAVAQVQSQLPGHWQATFPFNGGSLSPTATSLMLTLTAIKQDGTTISMQFPVGVQPCPTQSTTSQTSGYALFTPPPC